MAQASSAQREPSMEEILASIRRIIEDSDTVKKPLSFASEADLPAEEADVPVLEPANSDVVSFRRPMPAEAGHDDGSSVASEAESESARAAMQNDDAQFDLPEDFAADFEELQAALDQGLDDLTVAQPAEPENFAPDEAASRPPLVSDATGRQVAASFGELSDAFAASRRRSFDEMAEEMLRPMLQDWLDDNLPTLVERLVREEIERVARAGAR